MKRTVHKIKKGDIFVLTNLDAFGHEQKGLRPHVIVTQITGGTVTVAPCTTSAKSRKYTVEIVPTKSNHLHEKSFVLISQTFAADISILSKKIGHLDQADIFRIQIEYVKYVTD